MIEKDKIKIRAITQFKATELAVGNDAEAGIEDRVGAHGKTDLMNGAVEGFGEATLKKNFSDQG